MDFLDNISVFLGKKTTAVLGILILAVTVGFGAPRFIVTQAALSEQLEQIAQDSKSTKLLLQIQIYDLKITGLQTEMYQLKKLKLKKTADSDDLDRLIEVKAQIDTLTNKRDSLQNIILYKDKK